MAVTKSIAGHSKGFTIRRRGVSKAILGSAIQPIRGLKGCILVSKSKKYPSVGNLLPC